MSPWLGGNPQGFDSMFVFRFQTASDWVGFALPPLSAARLRVKFGNGMTYRLCESVDRAWGTFLPPAANTLSGGPPIQAPSVK